MDDEPDARIKKLGVAFHLIVEGGWENYRPTPRDAGRVMLNPWGIRIERWKIPEYIALWKSEAIQDLVRFWQRWKNFGNPTKDGWTEWPAVWLDIIEMFEGENAKLPAKKRITGCRETL